MNNAWKFFKRSDFACKCGCGTNGIQDTLIDRIDEARDKSGIVFRVTSGYRCPKHNKEVGGKPDSAHLKGLAVDISIPDGFSRYSALLGALQAGFTRIGIGKNFIHLDIDGDKVQDNIWTY
jgi:zinc D-Ala-D-Ala carboxypeptidase